MAGPAWELAGREHREDPELAAGSRVLRTDAAQRRAWLAKAIDAKMTPTERELLGLAAQLLDRLADAEPFSPPIPSLAEVDSHAR